MSGKVKVRSHWRRCWHCEGDGEYTEVLVMYADAYPGFEGGVHDAEERGPFRCEKCRGTGRTMVQAYTRRHNAGAG